MKLKWMREYRDIVEQLIRYCNNYALCINKEQKMGSDIEMSLSQIQVIEYLLENEELHQNMSEVASRLGITISHFSKIVNKLEKKGLLEKYRKINNKKDVIIQVNDKGRDVYIKYSKYIYENHFSKMFEIADNIPKEYLCFIAEMLNAKNLESKNIYEDVKLVPIK